MPNKLRVVVRADLPVGAQACQAIHVAQEFVFRHPELATPWFEKSNTIALLSVPNEFALLVLHDLAAARGIAVTLFREPDLNNTATALAIAPCEDARFLCMPLSLALREASA